MSAPSFASQETPRLMELNTAVLRFRKQTAFDIERLSDGRWKAKLAHELTIQAGNIMVPVEAFGNSENEAMLAMYKLLVQIHETTLADDRSAAMLHDARKEYDKVLERRKQERAASEAQATDPAPDVP